MPKARQFIQCLPRLVILDSTGNGVVGTTKVALGFELDISHKVVFWTANKRMVA